MRKEMLISVLYSATACLAFAPVSVPGAIQARVLSLEQGVSPMGLNCRRQTATCIRMQDRGNNRDKIFPKGKESIERAKQLDAANRGDEPSLIMREKKFTWPFPLSFLNTLKDENPTVYKAFQLAWFGTVLFLACFPGNFFGGN